MTRNEKQRLVNMLTDFISEGLDYNYCDHKTYQETLLRYLEMYFPGEFILVDGNECPCCLPAWEIRPVEEANT